MGNSLMSNIEDVLLAIQISQSKYKYDFISEWYFNQKTKSLSRRYSIVKYHIEIIDNQRARIKDEAKRGKLVEILNYLVQELDRYRKKEVDSS